MDIQGVPHKNWKDAIIKLHTPTLQYQVKMCNLQNPYT